MEPGAAPSGIVIVLSKVSNCKGGTDNTMAPSYYVVVLLHSLQVLLFHSIFSLRQLHCRLRHGPAYFPSHS